MGYLFWKSFTPPSIKLSQIAPLPPALLPLLEKIPPSIDFGQSYYPCAVKLEDGQEFPCVYIIDAAEHVNRKGELPLDFYPEPIPIEQIVDIKESPYRLPQALAQQLYDQAELSRGAFSFTVEFSNGEKVSYSTAGLVDFLDIPNGLKARDAVRVSFQKGTSKNSLAGLNYRWCFYRVL